jgi:hypothetical protein
MLLDRFPIVPRISLADVVGVGRVYRAICAATAAVRGIGVTVVQLPGQAALAAHEQAATAITVYAPGVIPEIARTPAYHRHCLHHHGWPARRIDAKVRAQVRRHTALQRAGFPPVTVYLDRAALENDFGDPSMLDRQRRHLDRLHTDPATTVAVRLITHACEDAVVGLLGDFTFLDMPHGPVAYKENTEHGVLLHGTDHLRPYLHAQHWLRDHSVDLCPEAAGHRPVEAARAHTSA